MEFGLIGFGRSMGERVAVRDVVAEYTEDLERVLGYGYEFIYRCPTEVGITELAEQAGRRALQAAEVEPAEVDLIVLSVTDITEYLYWDAAASLQHRLGATQAEAVLLTQGCAAGVLCFETVAGRLATRHDYRTAVLITANRTCEAYWNRMETQPLLFSDGAAAAVARRGHSRLRWRSSAAATDGRYADFLRLDVGGAASPFIAGQRAGQPLRVRDVWNIMEFFDYDEERFAEFLHQIDDGVRAVVERACARADIAISDLQHVIFLNDNLRALTSVAEHLKVELARANVEQAARYGHMGAADHLFSVADYAERGLLADGDLIALASVGRGMHWACTVLEA